VRDQQDVLRPYCSLHYAWDEPSLPHRLALELPGARHLGTFDLDRVREGGGAMMDDGRKTCLADDAPASGVESSGGGAGETKNAVPLDC
jgi:hypothetical protein